MAETTTHDLFISCAAYDAAWVEGFLLPGLDLLPDRVTTHQPPVPNVLDNPGETAAQAATPRNAVIPIGGPTRCPASLPGRA